jgi:hypothetical protein
MGKTDKDRPYWVIEIQENARIRHDHSRGECIEETPEYRGRSYRRHKYCTKNYDLEISCHPEKVNGKRELVYDPPADYSGRWMRPKTRGQSPCWTWVCNGHTHDSYSPDLWYCKDKVFTHCLGHTVRMHDASRPCVCDDWLPVPTCTYELSYGMKYYRYSWGGVPSWFVRQTHHKPERCKERKLRDYVREYNAYGELENDGDFDNRQARGSARWDWW